MKRLLRAWRPIRRFELILPSPATTVQPLRQTLTISAPSDSYVARVLQGEGLAGYERETMAAFLATIEYTEAEVAFDVGANIGVYSLVGAATTRAQLVGFEPEPGLAAAFEAIARLNDLPCVIERVAPGRDTGSATLFLSAATDTSNSLSEGFRPARGTIEVPVERLDDYVARTLLIPRVLKIDTESTEPAVIRGGLRLFERHRPWIICEVLAGLTETELMALLGSLGYHYYRLGPEGEPHEMATVVGDATYRNRDWLFAPEPVTLEYNELLRRWHNAIAATALPLPR
jgi:FkbM family methyltransferase